MVTSTPRLDEVWLVALDPTLGSEIRKTRPCVVISPDEMNRHLHTVIVAPMTRTRRAYPSRVGLTFQGKQGQVALDQIRAVDRERLVQRMGSIPVKTVQSISAVLVEMFGREG